MKIEKIMKMDDIIRSKLGQVFRSHFLQRVIIQKKVKIWKVVIGKIGKIVKIGKLRMKTDKSISMHLLRC